MKYGLAPMSKVDGYPDNKEIQFNARRAKKSSGYVYLLRCNQYHKVGRAVNVKTRIRHIQTASPYLIEQIHIVSVGDMFALEKELHKLYANKRVKGEWFQLDAADVAYICSL